jgi:hypothetical protein
MKRLLLVGTFLAVIPVAGASAQTVTDGWTIIDPASYHTTGAKATVGKSGGTDWINLNTDTGFDILDNSGADTMGAGGILNIYLAVPSYDGKAPTISSAAFNNVATSKTFVDSFTLTKLGAQFTSGKFYTFVNSQCGCDASLSLDNFNLALSTDGLAKATAFNVYDLKITVGTTAGQYFDGAAKDFEVVGGFFPLGTFVAPLSDIVDTKHNTLTFYDTSFTNTGVVNATSAVPEPSTWVLMGLGFALMGLVAYRRSMAPNAIA